MATDSKVAIITGGAQGIGKCMALHLHALGWSVCAADVDCEAGEELPEEMLFVETDVADESSVAKCVATTLSRFGRLDAVVNNAAISAGGPVESLELTAWNRVLSVNLTGPFLVAKHAAPHLREHGGAIVNISSSRALQSEANTEAYSASKGGLVALTHALAVSLGPEIRVNCICPGWIDSGPWQKASKRREATWSAEDHHQHPAGRVGKPEDIASMVAYLLSDAAGFMTGESIVIDGGMTRKMIYV